MEAAWLTHPQFETLVNQTWNYTKGDLGVRIARFSEATKLGLMKFLVTFSTEEKSFSSAQWNSKVVGEWAL